MTLSACKLSRGTSVFLALAMAWVAVAGCNSSTPPATNTTGTTGTGSTDTGASGSSTGTKPVFSLAWSEYPSWSVFGVAHEYKLVNGAAGQLAGLELKWGIDLELKEASYEGCLNMYSAGNCDAVCVTNMDALSPALGRLSVAVLPTSTSDGADACLVVDVPDAKALREHKVYGLKSTVSEYCFVRNLELLGEKEEDHQFANLDPAAAALNMQNKNPEQRAIMVWNPFVLQTLKSRPDAKVLFDSTSIPGEIVDMVVVAQSSLDKPQGRQFALLVMDVYYEFNKILTDSQQGDEALVALGEKFSSLNLEEMKKAVQQTKFYKTPAEGLGLLKSPEFPQTMDRVVKFCVDHQIVKPEIKVGFGAADPAHAPHLRIDASLLEEYAAPKP